MAGLFGLATIQKIRAAINAAFSSASSSGTTLTLTKGDGSKSSVTLDAARRVGTTTVGAANRLIYLNNGTPTASTATVGGPARPVYLNNGVLTACGDSVGSGVMVRNVELQPDSSATITVPASATRITIFATTDFMLNPDNKGNYAGTNTLTARLGNTTLGSFDMTMHYGKSGGSGHAWKFTVSASGSASYAVSATAGASFVLTSASSGLVAVNKASILVLVLHDFT